MGERMTGVEALPPCGRGPVPATFEDVVEAFCLEQAELRARLARAGDAAANPLTDQRNGRRSSTGHILGADSFSLYEIEVVSAD